jgi:hypothetical protein
MGDTFVTGNARSSRSHRRMHYRSSGRWLFGKVHRFEGMA